MFFRRSKPQPPPPGRPTDDQAMALLRDRLDDLAPGLTAGSTVKNGMLIGGNGPWAMMALPNHTEQPEHFDLGFTTTLGTIDGAVIVDCISGIGTGPAAFASVLHIWGQTSGACFLELVTGGTGEYATHLHGDDSAALPGWHTISSGVLSYGTDDSSNETLQAAVLDSEILRVLAPELTPALDRPQLNGIKVFLCRTPESTTAEIRVNGEPAMLASEALAAHPWPDVSEAAIARFYAVAAYRS